MPLPEVIELSRNVDRKGRFIAVILADKCYKQLKKLSSPILLLIDV